MNFRSVPALIVRATVNRFRLMVLLANLLLTAFTSMSKAQEPVEQNVGDSLRSLASRASVAFVGHVTRIECRSGIVDVTFAVDQQVLGQVGATYRLREWAGLWTGGQQHFALGQRDLIFVHQPTASGLTSTVDGEDGIVPVLLTGSGQAMADLRRLAVRIPRAPGTPVPVTAGSAMTLPLAAATVSAWRTGPVKDPVLLQLTEANSGVSGVSLAPR